MRSETRKPGRPPIRAETVARFVALTCADPPYQATRWTGRRWQPDRPRWQRIGAAHELQPHRVCTFNRSRDPDCAAELTDIVGLYMDPPTQAVMLAVGDHGAGEPAVGGGALSSPERRFSRSR